MKSSNKVKPQKIMEVKSVVKIGSNYHRDIMLTAYENNYKDCGKIADEVLIINIKKSMLSYLDKLKTDGKVSANYNPKGILMYVTKLFLAMQEKISPLQFEKNLKEFGSVKYLTNFSSKVIKRPIESSHAELLIQVYAAIVADYIKAGNFSIQGIEKTFLSIRTNQHVLKVKQRYIRILCYSLISQITIQEFTDNIKKNDFLEIEKKLFNDSKEYFDYLKKQDSDTFDSLLIDLGINENGEEDFEYADEHFKNDEVPIQKSSVVSIITESPMPVVEKQIPKPSIPSTIDLTRPLTAEAKNEFKIMEEINNLLSPLTDAERKRILSFFTVKY